MDEDEDQCWGWGVCHPTVSNRDEEECSSCPAPHPNTWRVVEDLEYTVTCRTSSATVSFDLEKVEETMAGHYSDEEEGDIYVTESGNTDVELSMSDSFEEKFRKLDIEAELSVSLLCGMIKLSGSGKYLDEKRESDLKQRMSMIYKTTTVTEEVNLRQLKKNISTGMYAKLNSTLLCTTT